MGRPAVVDHGVRHPVGRNDVGLVRHVELGQRLGRSLITGQSESEPITMPDPGGRPQASSSPIRYAGGMPGPGANLVKIIAVRRHVPDLTARPHLLAVDLDPQPAVPGEAVQQRGRQIADRAPEHVGHHRPAFARTRVAQRQIEHRPQVILELRGVRAVDGPVAGVVRPHGQLVDHHRPVAALHQLHRQHADHAEFVGDGQREPLDLHRRLRSRGRAPG